MNVKRGKKPAAGRPEELAPLPRGRHLLPPEEVERHQRERILTAVVTGMAEDGYASLTVGSIIARARVSRTTFYAQFANKRDAVLGAYQEIFRRFLALVEEACAEEEEWPMKLQRGLEATVAFAAEEPAMALFLTAQAEVTDRVVGEAVQGARRQLVELLLRGRDYPQVDLLPEITEEALVGAISTVLTRAVFDGGLEDAEALRAQLIEFALVFY
jgi:AcrR family transcriptional regulator